MKFSIREAILRKIKALIMLMIFISVVALQAFHNHTDQKQTNAKIEHVANNGNSIAKAVTKCSICDFLSSARFFDVHKSAETPGASFITYYRVYQVKAQFTVKGYLLTCSNKGPPSLAASV